MRKVFDRMGKGLVRLLDPVVMGPCFRRDDDFLYPIAATKVKGIRSEEHE